MSYQRILATLLLFIFLSSCVPTGGDTTAEPVSSAVSTITSTIEPSPTVTNTPRPRVKAGDNLGFLKGMNYVSWKPTTFLQPLSDRSLEALADTGSEWVAFNISGYQNDRTSTIISERYFTDEAVLHAINKVHDLDMNIMIKINVLFINDPEGWGGSIGEGFDSAQWDKWFASFTELILYYAKIAEENGVEMLCIGTEMGKAQMQTEHFKQLIKEVRKVFSGPITYGADHSAPELEWWDQVDYIGLDVYYNITRKSSPSLSDLEAGWQRRIEKLEALSKKWNKPIIFTEVGYNAQEFSACNGGCGVNMEKAELGRLDPQTQANAYQALFNVFRNKDWFQGIFWWFWEDNFYSGGMCDPQHMLKGKLAENVVRAEYGAPPATLLYPAPLPVFNENKITDFPVFTDSFGMVHSGGWGGIEISEVSSPVFKGAKALKFELKQGGGMEIMLNGLDSSLYQWLEFYVYSDNNFENNLHVFVGDEKGLTYYFPTLTLCNFMDNQTFLKVGEWNRILIPLDEIAADKRILQNVTFQTYDSSVILLDEIRFVGLSDPSQSMLPPAILPDAPPTPVVGLGDTSQSPPSVPPKSTSGITETIFYNYLDPFWEVYPPHGDPGNILFNQSDISVDGYAIKAKLLNFYPIDFKGDEVDWSKYNRFEFDLYVDPENLPNAYGLKVFLRDALYQSSPAMVNLLGSRFIEGGKIQPGTWQHVQIPLDVFGSSLGDYVMISIERPGNGSEAPLMVYVDNVMLRGK